MTLRLHVPPLLGSLVHLEPLSMCHAADLVVAAEEDRGTYGFTWVPKRSEIDGYLHSQLQRAETGKLAPFAQIRLADERAVGCTAYWDPRAWPGRSEPCAVEIGFTWLGASAQGTGINLEAKLLLFKHAFEEMGVARVDLKTDARNERSRRAIAGLGGWCES
ncbi:MAG: N-acetyltransferase, partial [Acidimicrobiales bacterium]